MQLLEESIISQLISVKVLINKYDTSIIFYMLITKFTTVTCCTCSLILAQKSDFWSWEPNFERKKRNDINMNWLSHASSAHKQKSFSLFFVFFGCTVKQLNKVPIGQEFSEPTFFCTMHVWRKSRLWIGGLLEDLYV